jgi:hypothetical protein
MGYDRKQLNDPTKPLYGFGGKSIEPVGVITLPISFGTPQNPHTKYIIFDVVDMLYPYNAIFGRGLLNTFEVVLHSCYLYIKITATFRVISIFGSQKEARNIKQGFTPGHKNVLFLREDKLHLSFWNILLPQNAQMSVQRRPNFLQNDCGRTTLEMRGLSPKTISGDPRRSENTQTQHISLQYENIEVKVEVITY